MRTWTPRHMLSVVVVAGLAAPAWAGYECNVTNVKLEPFGSTGTIRVVTATGKQRRGTTEYVISRVGPVIATAIPFGTVEGTHLDLDISSLGDVGRTSIRVQYIHRETKTSGFCDITVDVEKAPAETAGNRFSSAVDQDPVVMFTGELFLDEEPDLRLGGPLPLEFRRRYAALLARDDDLPAVLGTNWLHNFQARSIVEGDSAEIVLPFGRELLFLRDDGEWIPAIAEERLFQLADAGQGGLELFDPRDLLRYTFDGTGRLVVVRDRNGNSHSLSYVDGLLDQVTDGLGRTLSFEYTDGLLTRVTDGRRDVRFEQTGGLLTAAVDVLSGRTTYAYDTTHAIPGLLTGRTLPRGNTPWTQTFDDQGRVAVQTDAGGNDFVFAYSTTEIGSPRSTITDPSGNVRVFEHRDDGAQTAVVDGDGRRIEIEPDEFGRRELVTDPEGATTSLEFDPVSGAVVGVVAPLGVLSSVSRAAVTVGGFDGSVQDVVDLGDGVIFDFDTDAVGNLTGFTTPGGASLVVTRDVDGLPLSRTLSGFTGETYTYDGLRRLDTVTLPDGSVTSFDYDASDNLSEVFFDDGTSIRMGADDADRRRVFTDEAHGVTTLDYDANGNLTDVLTPGGVTYSFEYDALDRPVALVDGEGHRIEAVYDELGRVVRIFDDAGVRRDFTYDAAGNLIGLRDGEGVGLDVELDPAGDVRRVTRTDGVSVGFTVEDGLVLRLDSPELADPTLLGYDERRRLTRVQRGSGAFYESDYDVSDRPAFVSRAGGLVRADFEYEGRGLLTAVEDASGTRYEFAYDALGRQTLIRDPLGRTTTFGLDERGRVVTVTTAEGVKTIERDARGLPEVQRAADGTEVQLSFDAEELVQGGTGLVLQRDDRGDLTLSNGATIGRGASGRITSVDLGDSRAVQYAYDTAGRVTSVTDWLGGVTTFTYDDAGRRSVVARPNGTSTALAYDAADRVVEIEERRGTDVFASSSLERGGEGEVLVARREVPSDFDLTAAEFEHAFDDADQVAGFTYDAAGRVEDDGELAYAWDGLGRLTSISDSGGEIASFEYDAFGNLTARTSDGVRTTFHWNLALDLPAPHRIDVDGTETLGVVSLPTGEVLHLVDLTTGARHFLHGDEVGNVLFLTGDDGTVSQSYAYSPFGERTQSGSTVDNPFTYGGVLGVLTEPGTDLYHMRRRVYDAGTCRFLTPDPVTGLLFPEEVNRYQYAFSNPLQYSDPTGERPSKSGSSEGVGTKLKSAFGTFNQYASPSAFWTELFTTGIPARGPFEAGPIVDGLRRAFGKAPPVPGGAASTSTKVGKGASVVGEALFALNAAVEIYDSVVAQSELRRRTRCALDTEVAQLELQLEQITLLYKEGKITLEEARRRQFITRLRTENAIDNVEFTGIVDTFIEGYRGVARALSGAVPVPAPIESLPFLDTLGRPSTGK